MALTYDDSASLMRDATFIGRIKVACLKFANYILDEPSSTAAHNTRYRWAQNTVVDADAVASKIAPGVVMDPQVQTDGSGITDAALQTSVETAVQKLL